MAREVGCRGEVLIKEVQGCGPGVVQCSAVKCSVVRVAQQDGKQWKRSDVGFTAVAHIPSTSCVVRMRKDALSSSYQHICFSVHFFSPTISIASLSQHTPF